MLSNQSCGKREREGRGKRGKRSRWRRDAGEEGKGKGRVPGLERAMKGREVQEWGREGLRTGCGKGKGVGTDAGKQGVGDGFWKGERVGTDAGKQ